MRDRRWGLLATLLALLALGLFGCTTGGDDDDSSPGDDDTSQGDDDDTQEGTPNGDDDSGDDDSGDDDDTDAVPPVEADEATSIIIGNDHGDVSLAGDGSADRVTVGATFGGGTQADYDRVSITAELIEGAVTVAVSIPEDLPDVTVALEVTAPAGLDYDIGTSAGHVTVDGMAGTSGEVAVGSGTVAGTNLVVDSLALAVDEGSVALEVDDLVSGGNLEVAATGDIGILIPDDTAANLTAATNSGAITLNNLTCSGVVTTKAATCTLGGGGGSLMQLVTSNGDIILTGY